MPDCVHRLIAISSTSGAPNRLFLLLGEMWNTHIGLVGHVKEETRNSNYVCEGQPCGAGSPAEVLVALDRHVWLQC